jgi:hypothetical protein
MLKEGTTIEYNKNLYVITKINKNGSVSINHATGSGKKGWAGSIKADEIRKIRKIVATPDTDSFNKIEQAFINDEIKQSDHDAYSRSYYNEKSERENSENIIDNYVFFPAYHDTVGIWGIKKSTLNGKIKGFYKLGYRTREEAAKAAAKMPNKIRNYIHNIENNEIISAASQTQLVKELPTNDPDGPWYTKITYKNIIADSYDYPHLTDGWQIYVFNSKKDILFNDYEMYGMNRPITFNQALKARALLLDITATNTASKERHIIDKNGEKILRQKGETLPTGVIKFSPWNPHDTVF